MTTNDRVRDDRAMNDRAMNDDELADELELAFQDSADHLARLQQRLAVAAGDEGILDLAYRTVDSPVGELLLVATDVGLVRVAFATEDHDRVLADLAGRISPRILQAPTRLDPAARALDEYFDGSRRVFDVDLDWRLSAGFRGEVLHHLPEIRYGSTASYAAVAALADNPKAVRAVGSACATNPLPVVIPCHRVVRSDGTLGGYLGGVDAKRTLLDLEARGA
ncbi:methylated-DNA--[protein]-cysteine S-methyltransferase [soil metagenome]